MIDRAVLVLSALLGLSVATTFVPAWRADDPLPPPPPGATKPVRVGLVFDVGGRGDHSFNDAAYKGLLRARAELGADASFLEPVGSEDREAAMRLFAAQGMDLVLGVGFIFSSDVNAVARDYPNVKFACVDYAPSPGAMPPNVEGLTFRDEEGAFLVGAVAGQITRTRHVGFVGGMVNPLIRKFSAGYEAGVLAVCPTCVVHAGYAGATPDAFRDPARGKALATSQIAQGADVLFHAAGATGHGMFEAAREAGVRAIGVDADQHDEMPGTVVTSMIKRGDVVVFEAIRAVAEGRFEGGVKIFGLAEGAVDYVREGPHAEAIPEAVKARVATLAKDIAEGRRSVPRE